MKARIHRGAAEIGGNCVELEADGQRLVLDLGRPLSAETADDVPLPSIAGLREGGDPSLLGVVISHGHPDHYGLAGLLSGDVPLYMGAATAGILRESAFFTPMGLDREPAQFLADREPIEVGPFVLTPFLVDHSAFDAYALLVEAGGRRLFYSGDLRAHGRKASLFERLIESPPPGVDVLLMEGTRIGRAPSEDQAASEEEVEERCVEVIRNAPGIVLAMFSPQNVDRLVTFYRAALRTDRDFVMDLYGASIAAATDNPKIPQVGSERVKFYVPQSQRLRVKRSRQFERVNRIKRARIFPGRLGQLRNKLVMMFRPSMASELERADCLADAHAIWSMWPGYLLEPRIQESLELLERHDVPVTVLHASGHATVEDLRKLSDAINADRVVPIHTAVPDQFRKSIDRVEPHSDGEWWAV